MTAPFSLIPVLFAIQIGFLAICALKLRTKQTTWALLVIAAALTIWGYASATMAQAGVYETGRFVSLMPGLWLPTVPFIVVFALVFVPAVRVGVLHMADGIPAHWFVAIQTLRITALGTLIKTIQGDFPLEVELAIGVTDLAFGISAVWLFFLARRGALSVDALMIWHVVGVLIIVLPGEVAMQSGLPGPFQVYADYPNSEVMLDWPMVLAPSLVVPIFLLFNVFAAFAAHRSRRIAAHGKEMTP